MKNSVKKQTGLRSSCQGFTLIEILIVVAILGILAAVAVPSYQRSILSGTRSVAQAGLLDLANRQEQYYLDNRTYTDTLTDLGLPAAMVFDNGGNSALAMNNNQTLVASTSGDRVYFLQINNASATAFSISAIPQEGQADDTECATLSLTSTGARTTSGTATISDCW